MPRSLDPDEAALWARVMTTVRPLDPTRGPPPEPPARAVGSARLPAPPPVPRMSRPASTTLDGGWDKRIARGAVVPDRIVDLHGHTLESAYRTLDHGLDEAIAGGARILLLVTGKPPRQDSERPHARGAIRAAIGDWLAVSRHAPAIAAVRAAHPRHGGTGALYIVLRRRR